MQKVFSIAIDGPAGAGKSSIAKVLAKRMNAMYLDTGAMYRAVGLYMLRNQVNINDAKAVAAHVGEVNISVEYVNGAQRMFLDSADVSEAIRTPDASMAASKVSAVPEVRERMVELQRKIAEGQNVVMDGRDIGTVVLPDATLKIFLTAAPEERAKRRYNQVKGTSKEQPYDEILQAIIQRDYNDANRAASPMRQADDAVLVDTTEMTENEVIADIIARAKAAIAE
jgi:cytidylate kinase